MDPIIISISLVIAIIIIVISYSLIFKPKTTVSATDTGNLNYFVVNGTKTSITSLPVTITGASLVNYTSTNSFTIVGNSVTSGVTTPIDKTIDANTAFNLTADSISVVLDTKISSNVPSAPVTTVNGYISNGIVTSITNLPVTISNASYINYTSGVPFIVTGTSTKSNVSSNINSNVLANEPFTLSAENISVSLTATPVTDLNNIATNLTSGSTLLPGQYIQNGNIKLIYQTNGNLVVYTGNGGNPVVWTKLWGAGTENSSPNKVVFDGNLQIINNQNNTIWQTNTPKNSTAVLTFKGISGADILDASGNVVWSTNGGLASLLIDATKKFILQLKNTNVCIDIGNVKPGANSQRPPAALFTCNKDSKTQHLSYNSSNKTMKFDNGMYLDTNDHQGIIGNPNVPSSSTGAWAFDFGLGKLYNPNNSSTNCFDGAGGGTIASNNPSNFIYENTSCGTQNANQKWNLLYDN